MWFMQKPLAKAAVLSCLAAVVLTACASSGLRTNPSAEKFTFAVLPDTQYTSLDYPEVFYSMTDWLVQNQQDLNLKFVLHVGDIVDYYLDAKQWDVAARAMGRLDGQVPYAFAMGNHDNGVYPGDRNSDDINKFFPVEKYSALPTWGESFEPGKIDNYTMLFTAGGQQWMVVSLECYPRDEVLAWANGVVSQNPLKNVIIITHSYMSLDNKRDGQDRESDRRHYGVSKVDTTTANGGQEMWEKLVSRHANICMVFSGHFAGRHTDTSRLVSIGQHGNAVYQMLFDFQSRPLGGAGFFGLVEVDPAAKTLSVRCYSPYLDMAMTDAEHQYTFENVSFLEPMAPSAQTRIAQVQTAGTAPGRMLTIEGSGFGRLPGRVMVDGVPAERAAVMIDDFEAPAEANPMGWFGYMSAFNLKAALAPGAGRGASQGLQVNYNAFGESWVHEQYTRREFAQPMDLTGFDTLSFWCKGQPGNAPLEMVVVLEDDQWHEVGQVETSAGVTQSGQWQRVDLDISAWSTTPGMQRVKSLVLGVRAEGKVEPGTFWIDEISMSGPVGRGWSGRAISVMAPSEAGVAAIEVTPAGGAGKAVWTAATKGVQ